MTDQTINADKLTRIVFAEGADTAKIELIKAEFRLTPPLPTLADMTPEERESCQWMQATYIDSFHDGPGDHVITSKKGNYCRLLRKDDGAGFEVKDFTRVIPHPDLPKMVLPSGDAPTIAKHENDAPDQRMNLSETPKGSEPQVGEAWIEAANQASKESLEDRGYSFNEERTPQAGEAWLVENGGDHAVGFKIRDGRWVIYNPNHYKIRNPHLVTPFARMVPEA